MKTIEAALEHGERIEAEQRRIAEQEARQRAAEERRRALQRKSQTMQRTVNVAAEILTNARLNRGTCCDD